MQAKYEIKEEFTNETIQGSFLSHFSYLFSDLFNYGTISICNCEWLRYFFIPHFFFESLIATNLIVPFALNTIYLVYLLFKTIMSQDNL